MDLQDVVASKDLESLVSVPAHGVTRSKVSSGVLFCCFSCPCVQAAVHLVALPYMIRLDYRLFGSIHSP